MSDDVLGQRHTTPALLVEGDVILDRKGRSCVVAYVLDGSVGLQVGDTVHPVPLDRLPEQVVLVETAAESMERATALAQVRLGGEVVAVRDGGPYRVPARFPDLGSLLSHLYLCHQRPERDPKVPAEWPATSLGEAMAWHDDAHTRTLVVPHVHDESFYRRAGTDAPAAGLVDAPEPSA